MKNKQNNSPSREKSNKQVNGQGNKQSNKTNNSNKANKANNVKQANKPSQQGKTRQGKANQRGNSQAMQAQSARKGQPSNQPQQSKVKQPQAPQQKQSPNQTQRKQTSQQAVRKPRGKLKVMFLGGVGEIGKNMTLFEYGDSIVVLDVGMAFPSSEMPGVDIVIPDVSYLVENRQRVKGILLTHGHEDHIGALPFVVEQLGGKVDIYGTRLTLALVEHKLTEHGVMDKVNFVPVADRSVVNIGEMSAEFIHVSHSVAGSVAICLRTPIGTVLHTGDFKIDYTPLGNEIMNLNRIAEIGKQGVLLLMSESTNVEKPGYTMSETVVRETINNVFIEARGRRIIIATFASNVDRLSMIIELAKVYRRKIVLTGKSMTKYIEAATRVGILKVDNGMFVDIDKINTIEDGKLLILSTGSQGEPMSALTRMASGEFNKIKIGSNDTIVISANPIPGNERDVYNVVNKLYRLGANVVYSALTAVHVSGHACQEDLKLIYTLVKPKYFIPVHGEYRHLKQHAMLVENLKHKKHNVIIPDIGDVVEVDNNTFRVAGQINSGSVMVDGLGVGDVGNAVLRDRLTLSEDGILVCVVGLNKRTQKLATDIEIVSRGCLFQDSDSLDELKQEVKLEISKLDNQGVGSISGIKTAIQRVVRHYFRVKWKRNPVVLPIILEV